MDSMDRIRERVEALEQQANVMAAHTRAVERRLRWWRGIACGVVLLSLWSLALSSAQAADFSCTAGDGACLLDAINQANTNGEANTITLEAGTYTLTAVDNTTDGPNGLPVITSPLTITGEGAETTIITRDARAPSFRILHVGAAGSLALEGLTLRGGNLPGIGGGGGGAILNAGTLALARTTIANNRAAAGGGLLISTGAAATIAHSTITNNSSAFAGGGLFITQGTVTLTATTVTHNNGDGGGGLANGFERDANSTVIITDSTIAHNGGELAAGGIRNLGTMVITNTTIANNSSHPNIGGAGGILNGGPLLLINSTLVDNTAGSGGGIENVSSPVLLLNTLLARNTARIGPDCSGSVTSLGTNLVGDPTGCTITLLPTDLTGDPGLGDFTDDGTPGNGHFPLLPGSPAINAGNDAFCPPTDQLGEPRVGRCDIGAIEFQGKHHKQQ
jgi:hypothetical protein